MANLLLEFVVFLAFLTFQSFKTIVMWFVPAKKKDVRDEIVFITGAGSGLGRLMALRFASLGSIVVCVDINKQANEATVDEIKSKDQKAFSFTCDCSSKDDIYRIANDIKTNVGDVTILINNAGIVSGKKFFEIPDEKIKKTFAVNTMAHFWTAKAFLPSMIAKNHGHVVSIASSAGLAGIAGLSDYCSSKFAAVGFNESLQMELVVTGKTSVHTSLVCPYIINTGMFEGAKSRFPWLLPILDPETTVDKIMDGILTNQSVIIIPWLLKLLLVFKSMLPQESFITISEFFGASSCMDEFKGREIKKEN
ncbi:short-chain dehydrogenase/reductase family 16C member 6-like [Dendronephthya gigantea]|uniref:short-chain dehydrogenase/reductase family 16C member 6-like n=1 Tax=Dendronephthya gigantea TaxID=151771 RepID=UPI001069E55F|nr:short-chain dehydrogenase/reductase family 16C member 6-like [Dendronephthya gigantea]